MYKVILAEDEMLVRLGLKNSVAWEKYNMQVVADEENGAAAFEKFQALKPQLVITDLKMSGMDGMELIRLIRENDSECLILVISCMDDFSTLRDMMKYKLLGYVLKASMTIAEVDEFLQNGKAILDERYGGSDNQIEPPPSKLLLLKEFLLTPASSDGYKLFSERCEQYGYSVSREHPYAALTVFHIVTLNHEPLNKLGIAFAQNVISENLPESDIVELSADCIVALHSKEPSSPDINKPLSRITQMLHSFFEVNLRIITQKVRGGAELPTEVAEACSLCRMNEDMYATGDHAIRKAVDYILSHYSENLNLNILASSVGLSPNYFSVLFKKETGVSFVNYLNDIRIEKAKLFLRDTDEYLYSISETIGFNTFEYFSQVFKQKVGVSPGEWRKRMRK